MVLVLKEVVLAIAMEVLDAPNAPMLAEDEQSQVRQGSFATGSI